MTGYLVSSATVAGPSNYHSSAADVEMGEAGDPNKSAAREWKYEMRREAQQIIPGLLLGPFQASTNADKLRALGVTHIVCVRDTKEVNLITPRFPDQFTYMTLEIEDNEDQNLIKVFPKSSAFIESARAGGGTVLVHCNGGFALSPAIVSGYLMELRQCTWEVAVNFVQSQRYCISFNTGFEIQLKEYEVMCRAKAAMQRFAEAGGPTKTKRKANDDDEGMTRTAPGLY